MLRRSLLRACYSGESPFIARSSVGAFGIAFVKTNSTGVVEQFGKYSHTLAPGLNFYIPFIQSVKEVSNKTIQDAYDFSIKTKDNIFAQLSVAVQVRVTAEDSPKAIYTLDDPASQIRSYLDSEIRSQASQRNLDQLYEEQDEISHSVFEPKEGGLSVAQKMKEAGYTIVNVLVTSIEPAPNVKQAMNDINASLRIREAKKNEAEAKYIMAIKEAEAERDRRRLIGEGVSLQRLAILKGYEQSINEMNVKFGLTPQQVVDFVIKTQHLDALEVIGKSSGCKTLFMSHVPTADFGSASAGGASAAATRLAIMEALEAVRPESRKEETDRKARDDAEAESKK